MVNGDQEREIVSLPPLCVSNDNRVETKSSLEGIVRCGCSVFLRFLAFREKCAEFVNELMNHCQRIGN